MLLMLVTICMNLYATLQLLYTAVVTIGLDSSSAQAYLPF